MAENKKKTAYERKMAQLNNSVVTIENIDDEDFTHPYDGVPYTIRAGEKLPFPYPVGMLLAKHLAMRALRKEAAAAGKLKGTDDNKAVNLYTPVNMQRMIDRIVVSRVDQEMQPEKSEAEAMRERTEQMQQHARESSQQEEDAQPEVLKKDIVAELKKRDIKFSPRATKPELLELLKQSEMAGGAAQ